MTVKQVKEAMRQIDSDGSGLIEFHEFVIWWLCDGAHHTGEAATKINLKFLNTKLAAKKKVVELVKSFGKINLRNLRHLFFRSLFLLCHRFARRKKKQGKRLKKRNSRLQLQCQRRSREWVRQRFELPRRPGSVLLMWYSQTLSRLRRQK